MAAWVDIYMAIDRTTNVVLWRWPNWPGFPILCPSDVSVVMKHFKGFMPNNIRENDFENFRVGYGISSQTKMPELSLVDSSRHNMNDFYLKKYKCQLISNWIKNIHYLVQKESGVIPGIYIHSNPFELQLQQESYKKIQDTALEVLNEFHDSLWLAKSKTDVDDIMICARLKWII